MRIARLENTQMIPSPTLVSLEAAPLDWSFKGLAEAWDGLTAQQVGDLKANVFTAGLLWPAATLKRTTLDANRAWMRGFLKLTGVRISPHGKTTLAPELFHQQLEDGAWAITAATAHHVRLYRRFGISRIFMANQLVGAASIDFVLDELARDPEFDFYCLVDSVAGVEQLADRAKLRRDCRPIKVLVEMGRPGGRCGVRSLAEGLEVAWAVAACRPFVSLLGIETFEGIAQLATDGAELAQGMLETALELAQACVSAGLISSETLLLSAGGSSFFDLVAKTLASGPLGSPGQVILRSGCYITHDDGAYVRLFEAIRRRTPEIETLGPGLAGALRVWGQVQSLPEPGVIICGFGRRDVGTETDMPIALDWVPEGQTQPRAAPSGLAIIGMFDQHTVLAGSADHGLGFGDILGFGVSHPCTTFDKWRSLLVVDDDWGVEQVIRTYF
jgi:D-serine dehydratase